MTFVIDAKYKWSLRIRIFLARSLCHIPFLKKIAPVFIVKNLIDLYIEMILVQIILLKAGQNYWNKEQLETAFQLMKNRVKDQEQAKTFDDYMKNMDKLQSVTDILK